MDEWKMINWFLSNIRDIGLCIAVLLSVVNAVIIRRK